MPTWQTGHAGAGWAARHSSPGRCWLPPPGDGCGKGTCGSWCAWLARTAGIETWQELSPHSLRHSAITFALDAGAALRDVQDYAGHKDPRTTRRYDHARDSLDRNAAYAVAAYLA